jgi:hypothetical protein
MKTAAILGLTMAIGSVGCAATNIGTQPLEPGWSGATSNEGTSMHVGTAQVMDTRVNPLAPIGLTAHGSTIAVSYGGPRRSRALAHVDAESLRPVAQAEGVTSSQPDGAARVAAAPKPLPARVELDGGHFVLVWKRGSAEEGYRALAQEFAANGNAVGAPAVISPPNVDVMGSPQAIATDGRHVVATFAAVSENAFELMAVPSEVGSTAGIERIARK